MDCLEPGRIDVGVDLRRGDARMAEHLLHLPQVGPARPKDAWQSYGAASGGSNRDRSRPAWHTS